MKVNKVVFLLLILGSLAKADSFTTMEVLQPDGSFVSLTPGASTPITWTFAPHEVGSASPFLAFFFPLDPLSSTFTSTLTIAGVGSFFTTALDASICGSDPCYGIAALVLPRFYGSRTGTVQFSFGGTTSQTYGFTLMEPVPEPTTLLMFGAGLAAVATKLRRKRA